MKKLKVLELFSGTQSISKEFRKNGHETFTVDFNSVFQPPDYDATDLNMDIMNVTPEMILEKLGRPDVIWASPPCTKFSVAAIGKNWIKGTNDPKNEETKHAIEIVKHTLYLINELKPTYWFVENPRGKLRKMDFMEKLPRHTITYCQYGDTRMKPTDIWTNHPNPSFKPACKNGDTCHVAAPRGSRTGTQGLKNAIERARIPEDFCRHVADISYSRFNKTIDEINVDELLQEIKYLEQQEYEHEWQNEFTRQQIKEINMMIKNKNKYT